MISCTEFIPAYSELFSFLDENFGGHAEVERFWDYLFKPTGKGIPLINYVKEKGLRGAWEYSNKTLKEEAADVTRHMNEKEGWIHNVFHCCPSKSRLLEYEKTIGLKPYYDYCGHCDYYRSHYVEAGLRNIRNHLDVDKASCSNLIYDPKKFKGMLTMSEDVEVLEISSKNREYFHPDFHSSLNMGMEYVGSVHGEEALTAFLNRFTDNVYKPVIEEGAKDPLGAIAKKIRETYDSEKCPDALALENNGTVLSVKIAYCPAVKHLHKTGREVSRWFFHSTRVVMERLAERCGLTFTLEFYDESTGAAAYCFAK